MSLCVRLGCCSEGAAFPDHSGVADTSGQLVDIVASSVLTQADADGQRAGGAGSAVTVLVCKFHSSRTRCHVGLCRSILHLAAVTHCGDIDGVGLAAIQFHLTGNGGVIVGKALVGTVDGVGIGEVCHFDGLHHRTALGDLEDHLGGQTSDGHAVVIVIAGSGDLNVAILTHCGGKAGGCLQGSGDDKLQQRCFRIGDLIGGIGDSLEHIMAHRQGA